MKALVAIMILLTALSAHSGEADSVTSVKKDDTLITISPVNDYQSLIVISGNYTIEMLEEISALGKFIEIPSSSAYITVNNYDLEEQLVGKGEADLVQPNFLKKKRFRAEYRWIWESSDTLHCTSRKFRGGIVVAVAFYIKQFPLALVSHLSVSKGGC